MLTVIKNVSFFLFFKGWMQLGHGQKGSEWLKATHHWKLHCLGPGTDSVTAQKALHASPRSRGQGAAGAVPATPPTAPLLSSCSWIPEHITGSPETLLILEKQSKWSLRPVTHGYFRGWQRQGVGWSFLAFALVTWRMLTPATHPPPQNLQRISVLQKQVPRNSKCEFSHANRYWVLSLKRFR